LTTDAFALLLFALLALLALLGWANIRIKEGPRRFIERIICPN
jgi:hypothetical protein